MPPWKFDLNCYKGSCVKWKQHFDWGQSNAKIDCASFEFKPSQHLTIHSLSIQQYFILSFSLDSRNSYFSSVLSKMFSSCGPPITDICRDFLLCTFLKVKRVTIVTTAHKQSPACFYICCEEIKHVAFSIGSTGIFHWIFLNPRSQPYQHLPPIKIKKEEPDAPKASIWFTWKGIKCGLIFCSFSIQWVGKGTHPSVTPQK